MRKLKQTFKKISWIAIPILAIVTLQLAFFSHPAAADNSCGTETAILHCSNSVTTGSASVDQTGIWGILIVAIQILTAGVGVAALAGLVYGVILYTTSGSDPAGLKKALEVIRNVVIGIVAYALMWSALNWLIPGGVFNP